MINLDELRETTEKAQSYYYKGEIGAAVKLFSEAAEGYKEASEPILAASAFISAGSAYQYSNDYKSPLIAFKNAAGLLRSGYEPVMLATLLRNRAIIHSIYGRFTSGYEDLVQAENVLYPPLPEKQEDSKKRRKSEKPEEKEPEERKILDITELILTWCAHARYCGASGEWQLAKEYLNNAATLATTTDTVSVTTMFDLLIETGQYHLMVNDISSLERIVKLLEPICPDLGTREDRPIAWVQFKALEAHAADLMAKPNDAKIITKELFHLLHGLPRSVHDKLYTTVQAGSLAHYASKLP